jgi:hypothetical protein
MKTTLLFSAAALLFLLAGAPPCRGQWLTQGIPLSPGWNAVYLEVQPEPRVCEEVFRDLPVQSVWKWDRRFSTIQFTVDPATLLPEAPDWLVWLPPSNPRAFLSRLYALQGCQAYLIKVSPDAAPFTLAIKGRAMVPRLEWYPYGLNLVGFPVHPANPPSFTEFFRFTPEVDTNLGYANELFRLDSQGRGQRILQPARDRIQPGVAYWIRCARRPEFQSILHVTPEGTGGLDFGMLLVRRDFSLKNTHPTAAYTVRLRLRDSESPPTTGGWPERAGPVPLSYLARNADNEWAWSDFPAGGLSQALAPGEEWTLRLGVRRLDFAPYAPTGSQGAAYQSILEVSDGAESLLIRVPVTAQKPGQPQATATLEEHDDNEGLWVGQVTLNQVNAPAYTDEPLNAPAPLSFRLLVHVDAYARAWLLQQVVLGWDPTLNNAPHTNGTYALYASDRTLPPDATDVSRISSAAFPTMLPQLLTGQFTNTLTGVVKVGHADPSNPFLHRYHPMHDNQNWDWEPYSEPVETRAIERNISLAFNPVTNNSANPYAGVDRVSGDYQETLSGLRGKPIVTRGGFTLQRISRINQLQGMTP